MNFVEFLKNNSFVSFNTSLGDSLSAQSSQASHITKQPKNKKQQTLKNSTSTNKSTTIHTTTPDTTTPDTTTPDTTTPDTATLDAIAIQQLRKGNFVKIVKYKNSIYNYYKNYIGEIKEYNPFQNTVTVFLHAPHNFRILHLHEDHVIKL